MTTNDTRTPRERAEEAAADMYNGPISRQAFIRGFLARDAELNTVSKEQIAKAAEAMVACLDRTQLSRQRLAASMFRDGLRAAGFRIEGDK